MRLTILKSSPPETRREDRVMLSRRLIQKLGARDDDDLACLEIQVDLTLAIRRRRQHPPLQLMPPPEAFSVRTWLTTALLSKPPRLAKVEDGSRRTAFRRRVIR